MNLHLPVEDLEKFQGEYDFQMDKVAEQFFLKSIHPVSLTLGYILLRVNGFHVKGLVS